MPSDKTNASSDYDPQGRVEPRDVSSHKYDFKLQKNHSVQLAAVET
jgi:hypothetical protein